MAEENYVRFVVDVSNALRFIGLNAVGIVRVEREIAKHVHAHADEVALVRYVGISNAFVSVPSNLEDALFDQGAQPVVVTDLGEAGEPFAFQPGDVLISAGMHWDSQYFEELARIKVETALYVAHVVYDLIPILMPEYAMPGMDKHFTRFMEQAGRVCDVLYAISDSTAADLRTFLAGRGLPSMPVIRRLHLACDRPSDQTEPVNAHGLVPQGFALYVSTIEPRKNHLMLFNLWRRLYAERQGNSPVLVLVGHPGWNVTDLLAYMKACEPLTDRYVRVLNGVSDADLEWLYQNARCTLYPSMYEGWGLPITESLARGTPVIASSTSSMPEASQGLCTLLDPFDLLGWENQIRRHFDDAEFLEARRQAIFAGYRHTSWSEAIGTFFRDLLDQTGTFRSIPHERRPDVVPATESRQIEQPKRSTPPKRFWWRFPDWSR